MSTIIRNDVNVNVGFSIRRYPNDIVSRAYHPKNIKEVHCLMNFFMVVNNCPMEYGVEISYDHWDDPCISRIGAIMVTPAIFNVVENYEYLLSVKHEFEDNTIEFCGKDNIYVGFDINSSSLTSLLKEIEAIQTTVEFSSIWDVIRYSFSKFFKDSLKYSNISSFDDIIRESTIIMSDEKNIKISFAVFLIKMFSLYNPMMQDREFINNKNMGLVGLVSHSLFPNKISERCGMYGSYILSIYARNLYNYCTHYNQVINRLTDPERGSSVIVDAYSRYIVFTNSFIQQTISKVALVVDYYGKRYMALEDESQIPHMKQYSQNPSNPQYNILFLKNMDKKYKISLLKAGSGGYDTIEIRHL
jgi:hypothetical protein